MASRQEFLHNNSCLLCPLLDKRVGDGYVGTAFPFSFGAVSMALAWWLRWGVGGRWVPLTGAARGLGTCGRQGYSLARGRTLPSCPWVLLRAWPVGPRLSPGCGVAFSSDRDRGHRILPGRHSRPAGLSWSQALAQMLVFI